MKEELLSAAFWGVRLALVWAPHNLGVFSATETG